MPTHCGAGADSSTIPSSRNGPCDARLSPGQAARLGPRSGEEWLITEPQAAFGRQRDRSAFGFARD